MGSVSYETLLITLESAVAVDYIAVSVYPLSLGRSTRPSLKAKVIFFKENFNATVFEIWDEFIAAFPFAAAGTYWGVNVYAINKSGFRSAVSSYKFQLQV